MFLQKRLREIEARGEPEDLIQLDDGFGHIPHKPLDFAAPVISQHLAVGYEARSQAGEAA
jgi:hypothetical protein